MNVVVAKADAGRALSDVFASARDRLPGLGTVVDARKQAFASYQQTGLPHRRIERDALSAKFSHEAVDVNDFESDMVERSASRGRKLFAFVDKR